MKNLSDDPDYEDEDDDVRLDEEERDELRAWIATHIFERLQLPCAKGALAQMCNELGMECVDYVQAYFLEKKHL